ncbi:MAG: TIGR00153 family protein [Gammaproteobacteria bacterium]|nr:MAG: TIGR00153 family protein [Gammaproteobacteria bacterium]
MAGNYLSNMFGRSPISPLQKHMAEVLTCVELLNPLFKATFKQKWNKVERLRKDIVEYEHIADEMKAALRHQLPKGLFMPVDRRDVLDVLLTQDKIANQAKDIAGMILGRKMQLPDEMRELFLAYGRRSIDAVAKAMDIINELDELVETGFRGLEVDRVESMIDELNSIESETDAMQSELRDTLFSLEDSLRPTDVMFTYRLIEWVGRLADNAQRVGSLLQLMLAK